MALLEVVDLKTAFDTDRGLVRAVDGVSFTLEEGKTLGVVGESGCGKSVLSRSIMNLLQKRGVTRSGMVQFDGVETTKLSLKESRKMYGTGMAMIFQDPMTSLNPVVKIGRQLTESLRLHFDMNKEFAMETAEELVYIEDLELVRSDAQQDHTLTFDIKIVTYLRGEPDKPAAQ